MNIRKTLVGLGTALALAIGAQAVQANDICVGCQAVDPGRYLGIHDVATSDTSTFGHTISLDFAFFDDFFVFDVDGSGIGGASANFQLQVTPITNFRGSLFAAGAGTDCPAGIGTVCTAVFTFGAAIGSNATGGGGDDDWTFVFPITSGRYVLLIEGDSLDNSAYTGQLSFRPDRQVPEPGLLLLLGIGIIAAGVSARRV